MIIDFQDKLHSKEYIKIDATIAPENHKLKVAAYARVSSNSQDQLNSFSVQVQYYTNYIEKNNNWQFVDIYADEGISGTAMTKRSEFLRMIEDCRNGKIEKIITKSTSRFSRNLVDSLEVLRELKMLGVSVYFEKEGLDTQLLSGENLLTLYSLFAQEESISISQNCKKGIRMKMSKGQYVASTAPYGYRLMNKQLEIEPTEAEIVKKIFQDYISGKGLVVIAKELNQQAVPGKRRNCIWRDRGIALILRNERYIGDMLMQKTFAADVIPYNRHQNKDVLPKYYVSNTHQGIVSKVQFEVANMMLQNRSQRISRNRQEYVLSKKIICGECGTVYRRRKTNGKIYWVCRQHDADKGLCKSNRVAETKIFEAFIRMYNKLRGNYKMILLPMIKSLHKMSQLNCNKNIGLLDLNKNIAKLTEQNEMLSDLLVKGILDSALFISKTDELKQKLYDTKLKKTRLLDSLQEEDIQSDTEDLIEILEHSAEYLISMDDEIFCDIVEKIQIKDGLVEFILINGLVLNERLN